jgi:hypothetical protein
LNGGRGEEAWLLSIYWYYSMSIYRVRGSYALIEVF